MSERMAAVSLSRVISRSLCAEVEQVPVACGEMLEGRVLFAVLPLGPLQGGTPEYYGPVSNWANSPQPTVDPDTGAITGGIVKFADSLPGLYFPANTQLQRDINLAAADNNLGQYIPVAWADTTTYLGSDYYEIALVQYTEQMSSSLHPTTLRGYVQVETAANAAYSNHVALYYPDGTTPILDSHGSQVFGLTAPEYLGPTILAAKDRPVRVKFTNYLPTGEGGDLFLPVDTTSMGAGMGPNMVMPMMADRVGDAGATVEITTMDPNNFTVGQLVILDGFTPSTYNGQYRVTAVPDNTHFQVTLATDPGGPATVLGTAAEAYTDNRATLHLHGGNDVWISDGTLNQWITPAGENTNYPAGVSVQNVPDMPDPGDGSETFFYSNQQSARMMFYHDHSYGITRLNVYAGEEAAYMLTDAVERDLIARGILPDVGTPLVIQDRTFIDTTLVEGTPKLLTTDPTWPLAIDDAKNDLWTGHVYMPNQDPNADDGANPMGRWDYGPFFWPPWPTTNKPLTNPTGLTITNGGSGYLTTPTVTITPAPGDTTGSGATASATITDGVVTGITLLTAGTGYTADPIVTVEAPAGPGGVAATVTINTRLVPNLPNVSMTMESYQDTPLVNGTTYPYMDVEPKAYRFRVLNGANDRMWNLQLYTASTIVDSIHVTSGGSGYTEAPLVTVTPAPGDTTGMGATAKAIIDVGTGQVTGIILKTVGSGYTAAPIITIAPPDEDGVAATATATIYTGSTEVGMVPAEPGAANFPVGWTIQTPGQTGDILDGRMGGVPDPRTIGPSIVQIGTEGGFLPSPVVWPNTPIGFERNPKNIVVGSVAEHNLFLGPAERADIIIDFSQFVGKTVILYNDGPAAVPAADSRLDYFTADLDQTDTGGSIPTLAGYGPNTRTIMAFHVSASGVPQPFDLAALQAEFVTTPTHEGVFVRGQDPILVPQAAYNDAYNATFPSDATAYERIQSTSLTFYPLDLSTPDLADRVTTPVTIVNEPKAIQELFENIYGRMQATLGVELPFTNGGNQTTIPLRIQDPVTEIMTNVPNPMLTPIGSLGDGTEIWKITHNGVDTHPVHFHLFNVQVINRVGWDGAIRPPDANELGWKETVRMNPLEDIIVAMRPTVAKTPFGVPDSVHLLDPTMPEGSSSGFFGQDANGNPVNVTNESYNFGWEYMWHCHILSHEEMDMMRPIQVNVARALAGAPVLYDLPGGGVVSLFWTDPTPGTDPAFLGDPSNEVGFRIERADVDGDGNPGAYVQIGSALANATTYTDETINPLLTYSYRVVAFNAAGDTNSNAVLADPAATVAAPTELTATQQAGPQVGLSWTDNAADETGFVVQRSDNGGAFVTIATPGASAGTGVATYTDATVVVGNTYTYRVCAVNADLASDFSNTDTVSVVPVPAAPSGLTLAPLAGPQVSLTWTDNADNETGFIVQRSDNHGAFTTIATADANPGTGSASYIDATVQFGNTYDYRVCAANGLEVTSAYSDAASIVLLAAPTNLVVTGVLGPKASLTWTDNATNEAAFVVQRRVDGGGFTTIAIPAARAGTGTVTYLDSTTLPGHSYEYRVYAADGAFMSAPSNTDGLLGLLAGVPATPTGLVGKMKLKKGVPQITLTFKDNATNETGFVIERSVNGGGFATLVTLPAKNKTGKVTYVDTGTAGNTYSYRVLAANGILPSAYTPVVTVAVDSVPAAPSDFTATSTVSNSTSVKFSFTWTDNAVNESSFIIQRSNDASFTTVKTFTVGANKTSLVDSNQKRGVPHYYRILARNSYGDSAWVNLDSFPILVP